LFTSAKYFDESPLGEIRVVHLQPFRRDVFINFHCAQAADFQEFEWLLKYSTTSLWYEKPSRALLKNMKIAEQSGCEPDELRSSSLRPAETHIPMVWISGALTTFTDEDVHGCVANHVSAAESSFTTTCHKCTDEKSKALESIDLAYCLIFSCTQAQDTISRGGAGVGNRQLFKLVKCGSRKAAVAEAFHATGFYGWNLVFSCVMRLDEDVDGRGGKFRKVGQLWMLADEDDDGKAVRVFY
ncbi:hypothetical protein N0V94_004058, partial [Neodidymelliopsis sp. IMI 364377]